MAQDPVHVDPRHYTVEFENDQVRVLRIRYGPNEKPVMHGHPASLAVFLADTRGQFMFPDGKTEAFTMKMGQTMWAPAQEHLPGNLGDQPFELVLVELKTM
jgi:quercetin dioxygenase-like cupin family protein